MKITPTITVSINGTSYIRSTDDETVVVPDSDQPATDQEPRIIAPWPLYFVH